MKRLILVLFVLVNPLIADNWVKLKYDSSKAPVDNPLKGFIPYSGDGLNDKFPFSMEWFYLGLDKIMKGPSTFTFNESLEKKLQEVSSRGKQSVFRIYLDYPSKGHAVPKFLIDNGHKLIPYRNDDPDNKGGLSPDYKDEKLVKAMEASILALGKKYDGDPRIGFITVGYLGHWGEWHTYPNVHLMADENVQSRIIKAFHRAFKTTKYLLRYPNHIDHKMPCGLHDDSFAFATLYNEKEDWYFLSRSKNSGTLDLWKTQAIGGEIYPPLQRILWDKTTPNKAEDYFKCVKETHCSWLLNNAVFNGKWTKEQKTKAIKGTKALGYEYYVEAFNLTNGSLKLKITNKGVAPFYYKWPVEIVNLDSNKSTFCEWDLRKVLPGKSIEYSVKLKGKRFGIRVKNPVLKGSPLKFANETQTDDLLILK